MKGNMGNPEAEESREEGYSQGNGLPETENESENESSEPIVHPRRWVQVSGDDEANSSSEDSGNRGQDFSESVRIEIFYT